MSYFCKIILGHVQIHKHVDLQTRNTMAVLKLMCKEDNNILYDHKKSFSLQGNDHLLDSHKKDKFAKDLGRLTSILMLK